MVDFGSLIDIEEDYSEINPRDIFESLPKSSRINNLYDTQAEILRRWFEEARGKNASVAIKNQWDRGDHCFVFNVNHLL